ncbi:heavy metal translocating P-type ATPase [Marinibacterium sp. SX1]|uniref:heavy metal translocating P-type ATPase n=1 Tax=Marinibacterium sp. SX1 TaxID=3388424 RepID=UPI003D17C811
MSVAACPACVAAGPAAESAGQGAGQPTHHLVLPQIHCAACIRSVEDVLARQPGITGARVNLTLKRAAVTAEPGADPTPWIEALSAAGFEAHEARDMAGPDDGARMMIVRLGVAGFAMMNVMLLSVAVWSGASDATRDMFHWISAAIALPAALFAAQPFFANAWGALRGGRLNMDVPIALAILLACGMSLYETARSGAHAYFDAALSLTFFLLAGRVLDQRMRRAARSAARDLAALEPSRVIRIEDGRHVSRPVGEVAIGDRLWLAAGARLPVDGTLVSPGAQVDRSAITGESLPVQRGRGAALSAGEVTLTGPIEIAATAVGEDTALRRMARLVEMAENARSAYTGLADRAARIYAPAVHLIALAAFLGWVALTGDLRHALNVAIATLIITCPCALGLAVPAVATAATGRLFRRGLLVKSDTALERLAGVDRVVFDKTGTLTRTALTPPDDLPRDLRPVLRALASASDHPLSRGLAARLAAEETAGSDAGRDAAGLVLDDLAEEAGQGVRARWQGGEVRLGRAQWAGAEGRDTVFTARGQTWPLSARETLLDDAAEALAALRALDLPVSILTGDDPDKARAIGRQLGTDDIRAGMTPEAKQAHVAALQAEGHRVLMVGDGLNDTAALAAAHASIAPGTALEASRNVADIVLVNGRLTGIARAIVTARSARGRILENFAMAACYNAVAIPFAVLGFATPLWAALAMSASSVTVIVNAMRVR